MEKVSTVAVRETHIQFSSLNVSLMRFWHPKIAPLLIVDSNDFFDLIYIVRFSGIFRARVRLNNRTGEVSLRFES